MKQPLNETYTKQEVKEICDILTKGWKAVAYGFVGVTLLFSSLVTLLVYEFSFGDYVNVTDPMCILISLMMVIGFYCLIKHCLIRHSIGML